jgi:hypothetical protein
VHHSSFRALQALNTSIADDLRQSLEKRYGQRKNLVLLSTLKFLSDPVRYSPGAGGQYLEMPKLREAVRELCERLFPGKAKYSICYSQVKLNIVFAIMYNFTNPPPC